MAGAIDKLIVDFEGDAYLPYIVWITGEEYYYEPALKLWHTEQREKANDYFAKAIVIFDKAIEHLAGSVELVYAHYYSALCLQRLGDYTGAIERFETVLRKWTEFEYAWEARFMLEHRALHPQKTDL